GILLQSRPGRLTRGKFHSILSCHARPCAGHPVYTGPAVPNEGWPGRARLCRDGDDMPATLLDSTIFRDIFCTEAMRRVFSDGQRIGYSPDSGAARARVQARQNIIPAAAAQEIERTCRIENVDFAKLKQQTERIGYPVLPVVQQIVEKCREG